MEVMSQPTAPRPSAWAPTVASDWPEIRAVTALVSAADPLRVTAVGQANLLGLRKVAVFSSRRFSRMRPAAEWRRAVDEGRMLILSTFSPSARRLTEERSVERNHFAAALAEEICFVHAEPGGHAESLRNLAVSWGKTLKVLA